MKKLFAVAAMVLAMMAANQANAEECMDVSFYKEISDNLGIVQIYDTGELTAEIIEGRDGAILIERTIGVVLNEDGDGRILNTDDEYYNYISYNSVEDVYPGDVILTYFIYNPDTDYIDDILLRFDYVIDTQRE